MKFDDMKAFMAAVQRRSMSMAADALELSQPAITRRIQNFEEALGTSLLQRNSKPLHPTTNGQRVYEQCQIICKEIEKLQRIADISAEPSGIFRLGMPYTISESAILEALQNMRNTFPRLSTQVSSGWSSSATKKVMNGELDAAIATYPDEMSFPESIERSSLGRFPVSIVISKSLVKAEDLDFYSYKDLGWVVSPEGCSFRETVHKALENAEIDMSINFETFGFDVQLGLVASGMGLGLVPTHTLTLSKYWNELQPLLLKDINLNHEMWLIWPSDLGNMQKAVDALADFTTKASCRYHAETATHVASVIASALR